MISSGLWTANTNHHIVVSRDANEISGQLLTGPNCNWTDTGLAPIPGDTGLSVNSTFSIGNNSQGLPQLSFSIGPSLNVPISSGPGATNGTLSNGTLTNSTITNGTVTPPNPEARNGLFNALKWQYAPKLNGTKCSIM